MLTLVFYIQDAVDDSYTYDSIRAAAGDAKIVADHWGWHADSLSKAGRQVKRAAQGQLDARAAHALEQAGASLQQSAADSAAQATEALRALIINMERSAR